MARLEGPVTLFYYAPLSLNPSSARYVISPVYKGGVHTLRAAGGFGGYRYEQLSGAAPLSVNVSSGVIALVAPIARAGRETAVFAVRDGVGNTARFSLQLQVDVSPEDHDAKGDMFLVAGNGVDNAGKNDVWQSSDGLTWTPVTLSAAFRPRTNHQAVSYGGDLLVIGGSKDVEASERYADVLRSADGAVWTTVTSTAAFLGRARHRVASYGGSLWLVGGSVGPDNDVWRSGDGENWQLVTNAAAFSGRFNHQVVSYGGSLWLVGGIALAALKNDIWRSANGADWELVTVSAAFSPRQNHQMVSHGGSLWVVGGFDGSRGSSDVWRSANGGGLGTGDRQCGVSLAL